jgi:hypothetical protein
LAEVVAYDDPCHSRNGGMVLPHRADLPLKRLLKHPG